MLKDIICWFFSLFGFHCNALPKPGPMTIPDVKAFLAQTRCPDGHMPFECNDGVPQKASDLMFWRRHDWPHVGGQIEDSVVSDDGTQFITTWSYPPHREFVAANGDGGEVYLTDGVTVWIDRTQHGGINLNYFVGRNCGGTGWLLFRNDAKIGEWRTITGKLNASEDPEACPSLKTACVRYRLEDVTYPFMVNGELQKKTIRTIISEAYAGPTIEKARHMERFFMGEGWGRLVWEAWYTEPPTEDHNLDARCPEISFPGYPARPGMYLRDCRVLTDINSHDGTMSVTRYGWQ
jgi:hypothetical protein